MHIPPTHPHTFHWMAVDDVWEHAVLGAKVPYIEMPPHGLTVSYKGLSTTGYIDGFKFDYIFSFCLTISMNERLHVCYALFHRLYSLEKLPMYRGDFWSIFFFFKKCFYHKTSYKACSYLVTAIVRSVTNVKT